MHVAGIRSRRSGAIVFAAALLGAAAQPVTDSSGAPPADQRVADVGYRLATSAGDLCTRPVPVTGLLIHDLSAYPRGQQRAAADAYGLGAAPALLAVAAGSPAAAAGLRSGDAVVLIDGQPPPPPPPAAAGRFDRVEATLRLLDAAAADGTIDLAIERAGARRTVRVMLQRGCASHFITARRGRIGAAADGEFVQVSTAAVDYARTDAELATVLAHEFAHNILDHRRRLGPVRGRRAAQVRETEDEADRLGVYLMDRAGYPPAAALDFLMRYRAGHPLALWSSSDHSSLGRRIAILREEIARIAAMKAAGEAPRPAFLTDPSRG